MAPIIHPVAEATAKLIRVGPGIKILDIAASHGLFGIAVAKQNPGATIVALDFPSVLTIASENAERFGISDRYTPIAEMRLRFRLDLTLEQSLCPICSTTGTVRPSRRCLK